MKAVLIGSGWRSGSYQRISRALPGLLTISAIMTRSKERKEELRDFGWNAFTSFDEALEKDHDAVIVATRETMFSDLLELDRRGELIISETGFLSMTHEEKEKIRNIKGFAAEQYPYTPTFSSFITASKRLKDIDQVYLSGLHNHHAIAVLRKLIDISGDAGEVEFMNFQSKITKTGSRSLRDFSGTDEDYTRKLRFVRFGSRLYIHDFSTNQYHNYLLDIRAEARGSNGVLTFDGLKIAKEGAVFSIPFEFHYDDEKFSGRSVLSHITLSDELIYRNPFYPDLSQEDEIAIATLLRRIEEGKDVKSIAEGIDDAEIGSVL